MEYNKVKLYIIKFNISEKYLIGIGEEEQSQILKKYPNNTLCFYHTLEMDMQIAEKFFEYLTNILDWRRITKYTSFYICATQNIFDIILAIKYYFDVYKNKSHVLNNMTLEVIEMENQIFNKKLSQLDKMKYSNILNHIINYIEYFPIDDENINLIKKINFIAELLHKINF